MNLAPVVDVSPDSSVVVASQVKSQSNRKRPIRLLEELQEHVKGRDGKTSVTVKKTKNAKKKKG